MDVSKSSGFIIIIVISSILGALEGSALSYIFSGFQLIWLAITLSFGLLLMAALTGSTVTSKEPSSTLNEA